MICHTNLQPRPAVRNGVADQARTADDYHADVEPGESVRIWGRRCVGSRPDGITVGYKPFQPWTARHEAARDFLGRLGSQQLDHLGELLAGAGPAIAADWCEEHGASDRSLVNVLVACPRHVPVWQEFDRTFRVGDPAEYDHYTTFATSGPSSRSGPKPSPSARAKAAAAPPASTCTRSAGATGTSTSRKCSGRTPTPWTPSNGRET